MEELYTQFGCANVSQFCKKIVHGEIEIAGANVNVVKPEPICTKVHKHITKPKPKGHAQAWPYFYARKHKPQGNVLVLWCKIRKLGGITTMSKWEIMQRVADTRKEIETFAQDWADVPGGTRNPLAVADWERLWRQLDELFAELRGCAVA